MGGAEFTLQAAAPQPKSSREHTSTQTPAPTHKTALMGRSPLGAPAPVGSTSVPAPAAKLFCSLTLTLDLVSPGK